MITFLKFINPEEKGFENIVGKVRKCYQTASAPVPNKKMRFVYGENQVLKHFLMIFQSTMTGNYDIMFDCINLSLPLVAHVGNTPTGQNPS